MQLTDRDADLHLPDALAEGATAGFMSRQPAEGL
jgi:hypothetical protein